MEDFTRSREDKTIWSERPRYNHGRLTSRKTILDAETYAIIEGLRAALTLDHRERIFLLSDSQSALRIFLPRLVADFASLTPEALNLTRSTDRQILPTWVKGHSGNLGNTRADLLARTATVTSDNHPGPSYSHLNLTIRTQYSTEWSQWFMTTPHHYTRKPTHSRRHHRHHTRLDSIILFKLRSNKGWDPSDSVGTSPPPPCFCDNTSPRDGSHILECPVYSRARPPDITSRIHSDSSIPTTMKWIRHHKHFGILPRTSSVKWIRITHPGNLVLPTHRCPLCTLACSTLQNLNRHISRIHPGGASAPPPKPNTHACSDCTQLFPTRTKLDNHFASTHGCKDCASCFSSGSDLTRHLNLVHGGILCTGCS